MMPFLSTAISTCFWWIWKSGSRAGGRERKRVQNKEQDKWKNCSICLFSPSIRFASYLFGGDNSFTQGLPTASQSRSLTGWGAVPKSLWWAVTEDAVSLGLPVAPDGHNAATRRLGNNALEDTAVVSGMKDARFSLPVLSGQQTIRGFKDS